MVASTVAQTAPPPAYTAKVDALLDRAVSLGFTEQDFACFAVAAADQAGASAKAQGKISALLEQCECSSCRPTMGDR